MRPRASSIRRRWPTCLNGSRSAPALPSALIDMQAIVHSISRETEMPQEQNNTPLVEADDDDFARALRAIARSIKGVSYGSVEIVIQNSRVVQIERKEKFRLEKS